jgi:putative FmdB family regulatory protein
MPTYVYECKACEKSFEVEQRITADPLTDCECGGRLRRVIQPVGIAFKGSGFYVNDSAGGASKPAEKKDETASAKVPEGHAAPPAPATTTENP